MYMSPNFTKDILHKTKGSKGSKGKNRQIQYYINYPLLMVCIQTNYSQSSGYVVYATKLHSYAIKSN
jgi:hypothetical protein